VLSGRVVEYQGKTYHAGCYETAGPRCGVCAGTLRGSFVTLGEGFTYHRECFEATPRCEGCGLPAAGARGQASRWPDGRVTCEVCRKEAVTDPATAALVCEDARSALAGTLGLEVRVPTPVVLVAKPALLGLAGELAHPNLKALTVVEEEVVPGAVRGPRSYRINVLSGLPRGALIGVLGHEVFHVLQSEASNRERDPALREGSANYAQLRILEGRKDVQRARFLEQDKDPIYGEGLRRFERLVKERGEREAIDLGLRAAAFPEGF
jgi:hypothetical protein